MDGSTQNAGVVTPVRVPIDGIVLEGDLAVPRSATGVVLFAHGSGSSRHSPRNWFVARQLQEDGLATLLLDLLTPAEEAADKRTCRLRFDIGLLAARLEVATHWVRRERTLAHLPVGYFGASTGAAAAVRAAAAWSGVVRAVVARGGRPDLAGDALAAVSAPTLLIVGGEDLEVIALNERAMRQMCCPTELVIVPGARHLFEEPGALEEVARLAREWFGRHVAAPHPAPHSGW